MAGCGALPWFATALLAAPLLVGAGACARVEEGAQRPLVRRWDGPEGVVRARGGEVFHDGRWVAHGALVHYDREGREVASGTLELGLETGPWRELYEDGSHGEGPYVAGRRHGVWMYTWPDGALQERGEYEAGERQGRWVAWYEDGETLRSEVTWERGAKTGPAEYRHRDGTRNAQLSGFYAAGVKTR